MLNRMTVKALLWIRCRSTELWEVIAIRTTLETKLHK